VNANKEFTFRDKDNKHLSDFKALLPKCNELVKLIFGDFEVETKCGGGGLYLRSPRSCAAESMTNKKLISHLGLSEGDLISFESININNKKHLIAVDVEHDIFSTGNSDELKAGYVDKRIAVSIMSRRGQVGFRQALLARYQDKCAISKCGTVEALEAAHVVPHSETASYEVCNGLLLRADIHTLFDLYLLSINPQTKLVEVSQKCCDEYKQFSDVLIDVMPSKNVMTQHYMKFIELNSEQ